MSQPDAILDLSHDSQHTFGRPTFRELAGRGTHRAPSRLLLIDQAPGLMLEMLRRSFTTLAYRIDVARTGADGLEHALRDIPDVILLDPSLPDLSGKEVYPQLRRIDPHIPVIFATPAKTAYGAIEAMKQGAFDYLFNPIDEHQLQRVVSAALELSRRVRRKGVVVDPTPDPDADAPIVGNCPAMCELYKAIGRVAAQDIPVLITGESGTGKEVITRAICRHGSRAKAPFLALNCAAIPENLLESELFSHEKGAFTGADSRRMGKFEQCNGGTLFLDEIGDMPLSLQAKMLRILQDQSFERIGGDEIIRTDVRLIAATHRDLKNWSATEKFRPDLYYRLGVFTIDLPPLRDRGDDLPLLVRHYLRRFNRELGREVREIDPEAMVRLSGYSWPGNIRELQSVLKQALLQACGPTLLPNHLPGPLQSSGGSLAASSSAEEIANVDTFLRKCVGADEGDQYAQAHRWLDCLLLTRVMEVTGGNQQKAARRLGIARQTLRRRLQELGIHPTYRVESDGYDPA